MSASAGEIKNAKIENLARKVVYTEMYNNPPRVFMLQFCSRNRATVENANPNATPKEVDEILRQMWMNSKEKEVLCLLIVVEVQQYYVYRSHFLLHLKRLQESSLNMLL